MFTVVNVNPRQALRILIPSEPRVNIPICRIAPQGELNFFPFGSLHVHMSHVNLHTREETFLAPDNNDSARARLIRTRRGTRIDKSLLPEARKECLEILRGAARKAVS